MIEGLKRQMRISLKAQMPPKNILIRALEKEKFLYLMYTDFFVGL